MALQSMTGFARAHADHGDVAITWELRSVNGRGLEQRLRLAPGFERLEAAVRQAVAKRFSRGNVQASLSIAHHGAAAQPVVNEAFLERLLVLARRLQEEHGIAPATADGMLALRGVLEFPDAETDESERAAIDAAALAVLDKGLDELESARRREGEALATVMLAHIDRIARLTATVESDPSREPAAIRTRLAEQVRLLVDAASTLDESRLHAEAAFLATKADITEEIDRLKAHVASGRELIEGGGVVGRRLDFLAQEFNRESNTLCAKSNAASVTAIGLELKTVVDQLREQVQNVE